MGTVGQQNALFVTLVGPVKQFEAKYSTFFANINLFMCLGVAQMPRTREVAIFFDKHNALPRLRMRAG